MRALVAAGVGAIALATVVVLILVARGPIGGDEQIVVAPGHTRPAAPVGERPTIAAPRRLFASDSVWNAPLADNAALDPSSARLTAKLRAIVEQNLADRYGPWIQTNDTSTPLYVVPADQPTVRVALHTGWWGASLQRAFKEVPIPPRARPANGPDAHMTVWQPSKDRLWEFFKARKVDGSWHANFGGAISRVSTFPGFYTDKAWRGLSKSYWGATATSLPVIAGTMRLDELKAGVIPHALAMNVPYARPKVHSWPAQRTDGTSTDPMAIPEGARFRLDPRLNIDALHLPRLTRMMAVAAQRYGIIVRDQTAHAVAFFGEDPTPTGANPYSGSNGFFGGRHPNELLRDFPWAHLQLLRMELHGG
jgi:hypothetical protein